MWNDDLSRRCKTSSKIKLPSTSDGVFDHDGSISVERLREWRNDDHIPPNPPPEKVGNIDPKTICRRALELIDSGSAKSSMVMAFYIDSANRGTGNCWPSEETTARKLHLRNSKAVSRANGWWCHHGYDVSGQDMAFLKLARRGRRRPDGTKESNAYHIGWLPLIATVRELHWDPKLREEADTILQSVTTDVAMVKKQA
jgi:hypothetical protein